MGNFGVFQELLVSIEGISSLEDEVIIQPCGRILHFLLTPCLLVRETLIPESSPVRTPCHPLVPAPTMTPSTVAFAQRSREIAPEVAQWPAPAGPQTPPALRQPALSKTAACAFAWTSAENVSRCCARTWWSALIVPNTWSQATCFSINRASYASSSAIFFILWVTSNVRTTLSTIVVDGAPSVSMCVVVSLFSYANTVLSCGSVMLVYALST